MKYWKNVFLISAMLIAGLLGNSGCSDAVLPVEEYWENPYTEEAIHQQMALMDFTINFIQSKTSGKTQERFDKKKLMMLLRESMKAYEEKSGQKGLMLRFDRNMKLLEHIFLFDESFYKNQLLSTPQKILDSLLMRDGLSEVQKSWMYRLLEVFKQTVANRGTIEELRQVLMQFDSDVYQVLGNESIPILKASASLYAANYIFVNNFEFWLSLSNYKAVLEEDGDSNLESIICGIAFTQYGAWIGYALALGGVSAGTTALVGFAIGVIGAVVCSQA